MSVHESSGAPRILRQTCLLMMTVVLLSAGGDYWRSWVELAETDATAAAVVRRYHVRPAEELYDLTNDRWELTNLAADSKYAETVQNLRAELAAWMNAQGDEGLTTERAIGK
ncbi:MAG: hypothetical protein ACREHD_20235 [Pirellulales bacterium]